LANGGFQAVQELSEIYSDLMLLENRMSKITLNPLASLTNQTTAINLINANSVTTQNAIDNTLSRDGTQPNAMAATIDMNSNISSIYHPRISK